MLALAVIDYAFHREGWDGAVVRATILLLSVPYGRVSIIKGAYATLVLSLAFGLGAYLVLRKAMREGYARRARETLEVTARQPDEISNSPLPAIKGEGNLLKPEGGAEPHPGNLGFHLKALEDAGIVRTYYGFGKRPRKFVEIPDEGVKELGEALKILREVVGND